MTTVPRGVDKDVVQATEEMLSYRGQEPYHQQHYVGNNSRYLMFHKTDAHASIQAIGGVTLYLVYPEWPVPILSLDLTHGDVSDAAMQSYQRSIAWALEQQGVAFLPISLRAANRIASRQQMFAAVKLIDRDGLQCVFENEEKYYISGYDANESPPLYFLAQLPGKVESYKDALEALKPKSVKMAEEMGLSVLRQGDMFFIPTPYKTNDLKTMDAKFDNVVSYDHTIQICNAEAVQRAMMGGYLQVGGVTAFSGNLALATVDTTHRPYWRHEDRWYPIEDDGTIQVHVERKRGFYGTAHGATEMAHLPNGTMFARDTVIHDPQGIRQEGRRPDHSPLKLPGKKWYLVAKNTVPTQVSEVNRYR